jgi:hypothetical protein
MGHIEPLASFQTIWPPSRLRTGATEFPHFQTFKTFSPHWSVTRLNEELRWPEVHARIWNKYSKSIRNDDRFQAMSKE